MTPVAPFPPLRRGLVAILRGVRPEQAVEVASAVHAEGIEAIEVPLNSPDAFVSVAAIVDALPDSALIGAGTVLVPADVDALAAAGGRLMVSPNVDAAVMAAAARHLLVTMPGVMTPTEAVQALRLGASAVKFFPATALGAGGIAAIRAVLPHDAVLAAVGGVSEADFSAYGAAGVALFGLGSSLYKPGMTTGEVAARARSAVRAWDVAFAGRP